MYPYDIIVVIQSWAALVEGSSRTQNASGDGKSIRYWEAPNPNKTMSLRFNSPAFGNISFYFQDSVCSQAVRMISRRKYQYIKHHIFGWTLSIAYYGGCTSYVYLFCCSPGYQSVDAQPHQVSPFTGVFLDGTWEHDKDVSWYVFQAFCLWLPVIYIHIHLVYRCICM